MAGISENNQLFHSREWLVDILPGGEWLVDLMKEHDGLIQISSKPEIGKVPRTLREIKSSENCFDPLVVALGPCHRDSQILKSMESYKKKAACWFIKLLVCPAGSADKVCDSKVREIYSKFVTKATTISPKETVATGNNNQTQTSVNTATAKKNLRDWYIADKSMEKFNDEEIFNHMMFLDGCFILYFINLVMTSGNDMKSNIPFIMRDMFLLENQIPYVVLEALMKLLDEEKPKMANQGSNKNQKLTEQSSTKKLNIDIERFIRLSFLREHASTKSSLSLPLNCLGPVIRFIKELTDKGKKNAEVDGTHSERPLHLLDFLRIELIGGSPKHSNSDCPEYYFRSIMELKAAGIKIRRSPSRKLSEIKFNKGLIYGELFLPQMIVDDNTKTLLLNLIACEMCPEGPSNSDDTITSYICFLDSLIDHADDVKELRSKDILLNRLGSDEEVAKLFNELANNLVPDPRIYSETMKAIESHCKSRCKVWFAEMLYTHFSSPWTVLSLTAAIFLLFLTAVQTYKTVWQ